MEHAAKQPRLELCDAALKSLPNKRNDPETMIPSLVIWGRLALRPRGLELSRLVNSLHKAPHGLFVAFEAVCFL